MDSDYRVVAAMFINQMRKLYGENVNYTSAEKTTENAKCTDDTERSLNN